MPAIDNLLKRLGFVRLARYGLVLTPEGRIMSLRPAVLEDGLGGRIVGWPDGDLAAMELQKWEPARPAAPQAVATRLAVAPPPRPMPKPAVVVAPAAPIAAVSRPVTVVAAPPVAQAPQVDEDDWEWTIALARARVVAEESEQAAASVRTRARLDTIPPPAAKVAVVKIPPLEQTMPDWPKTEPITAIEYEDRSREQVSRIASRPPTERPLATPVGIRKPAPTQPLAAVAAPAKRPGTTPPTVIPIPKLPSITNRTTQIQPVISSSSATRSSRTRFAKGTGPVSGTHVGPPPPPPIRPGEDMDKTSPGMPAITAVSLPSIKRLAR
jgi:hypothetical protein